VAEPGWGDDEPPTDPVTGAVDFGAVGGTCRYPPRMTDVASVLRFFATVQPPDQDCDAVRTKAKHQRATSYVQAARGSAATTRSSVATSTSIQLPSSHQPMLER
jgi:hypothetical protein